MPEEKLRVPIRFEVGIGAAALPVELVLVAVEQMTIGVFLQSERRKIKRARRQLVVVIEQRDELALGEREGVVRSGRDVTVLRASHHFDPRILAREFLQERPDVFLRRGVVGDAKFPVRIELRLDRADGAPEPFQVGIVNRQEDGDERRIFKAGDLFANETPILSAEPVVATDPNIVVADRFASFIELFAQEGPAQRMEEESLPRPVAAPCFQKQLGTAWRNVDIE